MNREVNMTARAWWQRTWALRMCFVFRHWCNQFGGGFALCAANARVGEQRESVHPDSAKPEERRSEPEQNFENSVPVSQGLVDLAWHKSKIFDPSEKKECEKRPIHSTWQVVQIWILLPYLTEEFCLENGVWSAIKVAGEHKCGCGRRTLFSHFLSPKSWPARLTEEKYEIPLFQSTFMYWFWFRSKVSEYPSPPPPHKWPLLARSGTMSQIVDWYVKFPRVRVCSCSQNIVIGALLSVRRPPPSCIAPP